MDRTNNFDGKMPIPSDMEPDHSQEHDPGVAWYAPFTAEEMLKWPDVYPPAHPSQTPGLDPSFNPRTEATRNMQDDYRTALIREEMMAGFTDPKQGADHDAPEMYSNQHVNRAKKNTFSVDSPSFTPSTISKKTTFSSQAASAAPFTPRGPNATPNISQNVEAPAFNPAAAKEFTPQNYDLGNANSTTAVASTASSTYSDPFATMNSMGQSLSTATTPFNPYATNEHDVMATSGAAFFQQSAAYSAAVQPPNYHLYAPTGPQRSDLQPWQRTTYDWFIPQQLREELQKKNHATHQLLPNSTLPQVERWHSLVPIDTTNSPKATSFGYPSYIYKTQNSFNGQYYAMRRLGGYTLTNGDAILETAKKWKKVISASVVRVHNIFTTRAFGDTSLLINYDYHPLSKTLVEQHFTATAKKPHPIPENVLWSYIHQITHGLIAIHGAQLAARCIELGKVILTGKNRIRLSACAVLDVLQFGDANTPQGVQTKQQEDFTKFGMLMLSLATLTLPAHINNTHSSVAALSNRYSRDLKDAIEWLLSPNIKTIEEFLIKIAPHSHDFVESTMQAEDAVEGYLAREVENGRVARLMMKMMTVMTEADQKPTPKWSHFGELYPLKLFRAYVFGPTDADGNVVSPSMGHILTCLAKLDVGTDEQIQLMSRDEEDLFIISYRELKTLFDRAFNEVGIRPREAGNPLFRR